MREITLTVRVTDAEERAIARHDGLGNGPITDDEIKIWLSSQLEARLEQVVEMGDDDE